MALPKGYDYRQYLPTDEDFLFVFEHKQNGKTYELDDDIYPANGPYYYKGVRIYLACILLKWKEGGKFVEHELLNDPDMNKFGYYDPEDLAELRSLAVVYGSYYINILKKYLNAAWNLDSPEKRIQDKKDARKGEIEVKNSGNGIFHIIPYSMKYDNYDPNKKQSGGKMHIVIGRPEGNIYKIGVRGSIDFRSKENPVWDIPYFLTEQEARDFIANVDNQHIQTVVDLSNWRFVITDRWHDAYRYDETEQRNIRFKEYVTTGDVFKIETACGPCYMHKKSRWAPKKENLEEAIEKHNTLNQKLFDGEELKQEVKDKVEEITNEMIRLLTEENIKLEVRDVILTGSNVSYNYTKDSDIDVHILAKTSDLNDPDKLYPAIYNAYRRIFANKYDISFYGIPVEVYIEVEGNETASTGAHSVMFDKWIRKPEAIAIPDIDQAEIDKAAKPWKDEAEEILKSDSVEKIDDYINRIYEMRQKGLYNTEGVEFSTENLVFKEVRNAGLLDSLKKYRDELTAKELSLESLHENMSEQERRDIVIRIKRLTHYDAIVQPNGHFEIHLVKEDDIQYVLSILRRQNWVQDCHSVPGKFDFSHVSSFSLPSRYHTVIGNVRMLQHELEYTR